MELAEVVAAAVRQRQPELELIVREQVDAELARLVPELVERELAARRNGGADPPDPGSATTTDPPPASASKLCRSCGETKPLDAFPADRSHADGRRHECRGCRSRRRREQRAARASADEAAHPAKPRAVMRGRGVLVSPSDRSAADERRELLAELRQNGVEYREVDGRTFTVLHLPDAHGEPAARSAPVIRHAPVTRQSAPVRIA